MEDWWIILKGRGKIRTNNSERDLTDINFVSAGSVNRLPLSMGPPSKFRRGRNFNTPSRKNPVAYIRPGFRTGGGETLPLPDSEKERDESEKQKVAEELGSLHENNRRRPNPFFYPNSPLSQMQELGRRMDALMSQQYDQAGNRIGEQND